MLERVAFPLPISKYPTHHLEEQKRAAMLRAAAIEPTVLRPDRQEAVKSSPAEDSRSMSPE
jgi:hypothetical protein